MFKLIKGFAVCNLQVELEVMARLVAICREGEEEYPFLARQIPLYIDETLTVRKLFVLSFGIATVKKKKEMLMKLACDCCTVKVSKQRDRFAYDYAHLICIKM